MLAFKKTEALKSEGIYISDDLPAEMDQSRRRMSQIYTALKSVKNNTGSQYVKSISRKMDAIVLNGKTYTEEKLNELPDPLKLENIFTPSHGGITAFFTRNSPLSNFYPCSFEVQSQRFQNMEQYLALQKARLFGDHKTAAVIQQQEDLVQIKKIAKKVSGFKKEIWEQEIENILTTGLTAKFNQNRNLAEFLRNTGKNIIVEANKNDSLCAIGKSLFDTDLWDTHAWHGHNLMGKTLMSVRENLDI